MENAIVSVSSSSKVLQSISEDCHGESRLSQAEKNYRETGLRASSDC